MDKKCALVVGSAPCVYEDMANAPDWPLIVVNSMGVRLLGEIDLWCSIHGMMLADRMKKRARKGGDPNYRAYGHSHSHVAHLSPDPRLTLIPKENDRGINVGGSSGMFAVQVALSLGYEELILCGIPLEGNDTWEDEKIMHHRGPRGMYGGHRDQYEDFRDFWIKHESQLIGKVKSMSGWTRLHFGGP